MKHRPVGAELFRADEQTDMTKLTVSFRNSANAPRMSEAITPLPQYTFMLVNRNDFSFTLPCLCYRGSNSECVFLIGNVSSCYCGNPSAPRDKGGAVGR